jgi:hypothetical protein
MTVTVAARREVFSAGLPPTDGSRPAIAGVL